MTREEILAMEPGPEMDALVAEKFMSWQKTQLTDMVLNPHFFEDPSNNRMYVENGKSDYLVRPGRLEIQEPIIVREVIGSLTIGGDQDLPHYSTDDASALGVLDAIKDKFDVVSLIYCNGSWECGFTPLNSMSTFSADIRYDSPSLPDAICTAALLTTVDQEPLPFADEESLEVGD